MDQNRTLIGKAMEGLDASLDFFSAFPDLIEGETFVEFRFLQKELSLARAAVRDADRKSEVDLQATLRKASALLREAGEIIRHHGFPFLAAEEEGIATEIRTSE